MKKQENEIQNLIDQIVVDVDKEQENVTSSLGLIFNLFAKQMLDINQKVNDKLLQESKKISSRSFPLNNSHECLRENNNSTKSTDCKNLKQISDNSLLDSQVLFQSSREGSSGASRIGRGSGFLSGNTFFTSGSLLLDGTQTGKSGRPPRAKPSIPKAPTAFENLLKQRKSSRDSSRGSLKDLILKKGGKNRRDTALITRESLTTDSSTEMTKRRNTSACAAKNGDSILSRDSSKDSSCARLNRALRKFDTNIIQELSKQMKHAEDKKGLLTTPAFGTPRRKDSFS
jgi:hypothetical protein